MFDYRPVASWWVSIGAICALTNHGGCSDGSGSHEPPYGGTAGQTMGGDGPGSGSGGSEHGLAGHAGQGGANAGGDAAGSGGSQQAGEAGQGACDAVGGGVSEGGSAGGGVTEGGAHEGGAAGTGECLTSSKLDSPNVKWLGACAPVDLSDDGKTVLALEGVWRADTGWQPLPGLASAATSTPMLLSGDGNVVFGCGRSGSASELYRWTAAGGVVGLGSPCANVAGEYAERLGTNFDGSVLVSCGHLGESSLGRWTAGGGFQAVETGGSSNVCLHGSVSMSANGATMVADSEFDGNGLNNMFYVESSTTVTVVHEIVPTHPMVTAVSGDGRRVAIYYPNASGSSIETSACLFTNCEHVPPLASTVLTGLNHDGTAGFGIQTDIDAVPGFPSRSAPFYWTEAAGVRHLSDAFFDHGVYLDVARAPAKAMSEDGTAFVGTGARHRADGSNSTECFLAHFGDARADDSAAPLPAADEDCGNGTVDEGEACDDGNSNDGDGCTSRCERPRLTSADTQTCLIQTGRVACWGAGSSTSAAGSGAWSPSFVDGIDDAIQVAASGDHSCALRANGRVSCWGGNSFGQLGDGTTLPSQSPVLVAGLSAATSISVGDYHSCALLADGSVRCWGLDLMGGSSPVPAPVPDLEGVTQLVAGDGYACALLADATVRCWSEDTDTPTVVSGLDDVRTIAGAAGFDANVCALRFDGEVHCWIGAFPGWGTTPYGVAPAGATQLVVSGYDARTAGVSEGIFMCARLDSGSVACLGTSAHGQLGSGNRRDRWTFGLVDGIQDAVEISSGKVHACARLAGGQVRCWGGDEAGELGIGFKHTNNPFGLATPAEVTFCP